MMARPSGAASYALRKNAATEDDPRPQQSYKEGLTSLKFGQERSSKRQAPANTHASREQHGAIRRTRSSEAVKIKEERHFYETDGTSIDESTVSAQTRRNNQPNQGEESVEGDDEGSGESDPDGGDITEEVPQNAQIRKRQIPPKHATPQADNFGHVEGDTYPDTTSDPTAPSDANGIRQDFDGMQVQPAYRAPHQAQVPIRSQGTRVGLPEIEQAHPDRQQQHPQNMLQILQGPVSTNLNDVMGDLNGAFAFAPAARGMRNPPNAAQQTPAGNNASHGQASNAVNPSNAAQQGSVRDENQAPAMDRQQRPAQDVPRPNTPQIPSKSANPQHKARRKSGQPPPVAPPTHIQPPQAIGSNRGTGKMRPMQVPREEPAIEPTREPEPIQEPDTDYPPPQLHTMKFDDIHQQSFDFDPTAGEFKFADNVATNDLSQKLNVVGKMSPDVQGSFFESLDIETWEEAGDWFLQRFGSLTKQLKDNRRQKRKQVQILEEEIRNRHDAVSKKQKTTIDALSEMKESGGKVLQGTPKKARKSK